MTKRSFLFLQGVASPFFNQLGYALKSSGHPVFKINFCGGDVTYWKDLSAWDFTGRHNELAEFIQKKLNRHSIDCILLFGDNRPIHKIAIKQAELAGVQVFVFEEGYMRPNWITLEPSGVNGHSRLPKDPDWYREFGPTMPDYENGAPVGPSLRTRTLHDMRYHLANLLYSRRFPEFRTHRPYKAHIEYAGWIKRFSALPYYGRQADKIICKLVSDKTPYFLFPMQLDADTQIRAHSPFNGMQQAISQIIHSFSQHARSNQILIIKNHPLDTGLIDYRGHIRSLINQHGLGNRIRYIDGGHLPTLLKHTKGTITINSTVGISALFHSSPTIALGDSIYNLAGLTYQGNLDSFWNERQTPDRKLFRLFRNSVIHLSQINGGFYTQAGINMALPGCVQRLLDKSSWHTV